MNLEYPKVCRLCADDSCTNFIPIFKRTGLLNFAEKIKYYLHVEIKNSNDENNEPRMCDVCYEKILNWDKYAEQVQKVQGMFMSMTTDKNEETTTSAIQNSVIKEPQTSRNEKQQQESEKKKKKFHLVKKPKKVSYLRNKGSDFSDEDCVPLAQHLDSMTDVITNRSKDKCSKKSKPKIKLKIKPISEKNAKSTNDICEIVQDFKSNIAAANNEEIKEGLDENEYNNGDETNDLVDDGEGENAKGRGEQHPLFTWECLECHSPVKNWNALVKHCKENHNSNASVQCVCGKFLQSRASIMKHRMKHTIGYGYKCEFENCKKTFHRQQLLDVHSLSHMPKELQPWMCCKCSRRFHTESLLKQHEKVHLPKEEKLIHPCEVCQKKFCSKSAVSAHIRAVHFGERPYVCDQCGHSFTSKGILHEHLTIHSDVYNFHCKDCNKSFKTKYRLKIHMDTHVETRYQCPICTLTLNTRRTLRMHLLVHREDKAFQCTTCGKAFKRSKDLKNHYNLHTGRRPYTCPFCQRTFANGSNCRSHKRRMHPDELKVYEAALAAGQQPVICSVNNQSNEDQIGEPLKSEVEFLEDSNESKSNASDSNYNNLKCTSEDSKHTSSAPYEAEKTKLNCVVKVESDNVEKIKFTYSCNPLNLKNGETKTLNIEEKEKEERKKNGNQDENKIVGTVVSNRDENVIANFAHITFTNSPQNAQYPIHNFYTFQSSGIPAFPGNPFFRQ